jgi:hypothetical protein
MSHEAKRMEDGRHRSDIDPLFCLKFLETKTIIFSQKERKSRKSDKEVCDKY